MFRYFHTYFPDAWEGFVKNGFIDEYAAIRFPHSISGKDYIDFNSVAAKDGEFYNLVKSLKCPMYIDRLEGGSYYYDYAFDQI